MIVFFPIEDFTADEYKIIHRFLNAELTRHNQQLQANEYSRGTFIQKDGFCNGLLELAEDCSEEKGRQERILDFQRRALEECHSVTSG